MTTHDLDTAGTAACFVDAWRYMTSQYPGHLLAEVGPVAVAPIPAEHGSAI